MDRLKGNLCPAMLNPHLPDCRPPPEHIQRRLDEHRKWLDTYGEEGRLMTGNDDDGGRLEMTGLCLDGVDLTLAFLVAVDFSGSSLRGAWFTRAYLWGDASFEGCDLTGAHFDNADLDGVNFVGAICAGTSFVGSNPDKAFWSENQLDALRRNLFEEHGSRDRMAPEP